MFLQDFLVPFQNTSSPSLCHLHDIKAVSFFFGGFPGSLNSPLLFSQVSLWVRWTWRQSCCCCLNFGGGTFFWSMHFFFTAFWMDGLEDSESRDTVCLGHYTKFGYLIMKFNSSSPRAHLCCSSWVMPWLPGDAPALVLLSQRGHSL